ncbi:Kelch repeat-containing protein [Alishewanella sp. HL-SH05]|uniref:Kelch repeat-containing protein n=1 Tax=Alishewanella sp. HL-SH05 TaxID=3461145 RepID=UPI0040418B0A
MRIIILFFLLYSCNSVATTQWQRLADMPLAVQEIYPAAHNGKIYVAGGLSDSLDMSVQQMTALVQVYDPANDSWSLAAELPAPRHHAYLVSVQQQLFLFGGFVEANDGRWSASADILRLDEAAKRWQNVGQLPKPLTETTAVVIANKVHFASGRSPIALENAQWRDQADVNWHWIFDPVTLSVQEAPALSQAFNSAAAVNLAEQFYIVGGRQVGGSNLALLQRFDPLSGKWQTLAPLPQAQGGLAAAVIDQQIWVFGGEYFTDGGGVYSEAWAYQPESNTWQALPAMPIPRHGLGAVTLDNAIYVIGGATTVGLKDTSAVLERVRVVE